MDTDSGYISCDKIDVPKENDVSAVSQDSELQTHQTESGGKACKETVEILSVEVVQSVVDIPQHNPQIEVDGEDIVLSETKANHIRTTGSNSENNFVDTIILPEERIHETLEEPESGPTQNSKPCEIEVTDSDLNDVVIENHEDLNCSATETKNNARKIEEISPKISEECNENLDTSIADPIATIDTISNSSSSAPCATDLSSTTALSTTGLSMLAEYGSADESNDSENGSVFEVPATTQDYRSQVVEIDSDSDSDADSSGSDVEYLNEIRKAIDKRIEFDDDDDEEDCDEDTEIKGTKSSANIRKKPTQKIKAKGELQLDQLPPIEDLHITVPEDECIVLGKIDSIVDQLVLVSALPQSLLVDLESVLFLDKGQRVLGAVFDVLGQVNDPLYCVRFNSNEQINEKNIKVNDVVYLAPKSPYTQYIILSSIMKQKGSDASWEHDLEPPPRFLDYSDDEEQQRARRQTRNVDRPMENDDQLKRQRINSEESQKPTVSSKAYNPQMRQRFPTHTRGRGGQPPNRGGFVRPGQQFYAPHRNAQVPMNHNPSSWHSNYYPHAYSAMPPQNVPFSDGPPRMPIAYPPIPMYQIPVPYHATQHMPPNNQNNTENQQHFMPNSFHMRPPTIPGHFDNSPPPPGSQ